MEKWIVRRTIRLTQEVEAETRADALDAFCEANARVETLRETAYRGCFIDIQGQVYHKSPQLKYIGAEE